MYANVRTGNITHGTARYSSKVEDWKLTGLVKCIKLSRSK